MFYCFSFNIRIVTTVSIAKNTINITKKLVFSIDALTAVLFKIGRTKRKQINIFIVVTIKNDMPNKSKLRERTRNIITIKTIENTPKKRYKLTSEYEKESWAIPVESKTN